MVSLLAQGHCQTVEFALPVAALFGEPVFDRSKRLRLLPASTHAARLFRSNNPARFQHLDVLHDGG